MEDANVFAGSVLLDCCRNVPDFLAELGAKRSIGSARALPTGMSDASPKLHDVMVTFATAPGTEALDRSTRLRSHSPFTAALLTALERPLRLLDLNPLLTDAVLKDTGGKQRPHVGGSYGTEAGNLRLVAGAADAGAQEAVAQAARRAKEEEADRLAIAQEAAAVQQQERDEARMAKAATEAAEAMRLAASNADIQRIVTLMKEHPSSAAVQENGCWALINLTSNNDANKVKAGGCGAIEAVVAALRAHPSSAAVQEKGCWALINLTSNDANEVKAGGCGANEAAHLSRLAITRAHQSVRVTWRRSALRVSLKAPRFS